MRGRRSHVRFSFSKSDGVLTLLRDIVVQTTQTGELVALDAEPRLPGDILTLETIINSEPVTISVRIIACRPIVRHGGVVHELVMRPLEENR